MRTQTRHLHLQQTVDGSIQLVRYKAGRDFPVYQLAADALHFFL